MPNDTAATEQMGEVELRRRVAELEEALRQSALILQAVIDHIPGLVYIRDTDWRFTVVNRGVSEYIRSQDGIVGKRDTELFPPEIVDVWRVNDEQILATGATIEAEESAPYEDGIHTHRSIKFPVRDGEGRVSAIGGMSIDITAQKRAEEGLRERNELLRSILFNTPIMIYSIDPEGTFTFAEGKGLEALGLDPAQVVGRSAFEIWRDKPGLLAHVREALAGRSASVVEELGERTFETWYLPAQGGGGEANGIIGVSLDVTDRRRAEIEQSVQAQIIEAQRAAIRELSTPLIPLTSDAVIIPLIGSMDPVRAQQFMEALLNGVSTRGAAVAIVDVTGVSTIDAQVTQALVKAAQAARMLGAQVVMTGISPGMAQVLVQLGIGFDDVVVYGSLQDGIAHVMRLRERKPRR